MNERLNAKVVEIEWDQKEMKSTFEERLRDRGTAARSSFNVLLITLQQGTKLMNSFFVYVQIEMLVVCFRASTHLKN